MSISFGLGLGLHHMWADSAEFTELVTVAEGTGWDSLWFSEHLTGPTPAALPQIAYAAALTSRMRLGTSVTVVPGRSPIDLAKNLSTTNELADGRLLPIFGLGTAEQNEHAAFGVRRVDRARWLDEALPVIRSLLAGEDVECTSDLFSLPGTGIGALNPRPIASLWMGGRDDRELRRAGRLADGWLGSFATPAATRHAVGVVREQARISGRTIEEDHYGLLLPYARVSLPERMDALLEANYPHVRKQDLCPVGPAQLAELLSAHVLSGIAKFIVVPAEKPVDWSTELPRLADDVRCALASRPHTTLETA